MVPTLNHAPNLTEHIPMPVLDEILRDGDGAVLKVLILGALDGDASDAVVGAVKIVLLRSPDVADELAAHGPLGGPIFEERLRCLFIYDDEGAVRAIDREHVKATAVEERIAGLGVVDGEWNGDCELEGGCAVVGPMRLERILVRRILTEVIHDGAEGCYVSLWVGARWFVKAPELREGNVGLGKGLNEGVTVAVEGGASDLDTVSKGSAGVEVGGDA